MPRKITGRVGMPKMDLTCPSCGVVRTVQYREPSRRTTNCRHCATFKGGRKPVLTKGWTQESWKAQCKEFGVPNAKRFDGSASGSAHPNWKGGITSANRLARTTADTLAWRVSVFERDDYTCAICSLRGVHLHAHHIKPFCSNPELRHAIENGVTLCPRCHLGIVHGGHLQKPTDLVFQYPFHPGHFDVTTTKWYPSY
jgi:HNH endonuclease